MSGAGKVVVANLMPLEEVAPAFMLSIEHLMVYDLQNHQRILGGGGRMASFAGTERIADARNQLCEQFLPHQAEWLFMVDADMAFTPDAIDRLIDAAHPERAPVIGGLCLGLRIEGYDTWTHVPNVSTFPTMYAYKELDGVGGFAVFDEWPDDELVRVAATGAACLLIHRSALERVAEQHGMNWFTRIQRQGDDFLGEDMSFCVRLATCDIPLHVHTGVKVAHQKPTWLVPS